MGDPTTLLSAVDARHLLRRTGFGAHPQVVSALTGLTRAAAVDELIAFTPSGFTPKGRTFQDVYDKWLKYLTGATGKANITSARVGLQEKLVLFWHDHFATGIGVVGDSKLMAAQNRLFRRRGTGSFKALVKAVNTDIAMMEFLDTVRNFKAIPNENYARELQELFTLGIKDYAGHPTYTQADIVQIARAFTGWSYTSNTFEVVLRGPDHDVTTEFPERGPKVIYQSNGGFGPGGRDFTVDGEGAPEIDAVIDIIFAHVDTDGRSTVARHLAGKLIEYFAHPAPALALVDEVVDASNFASSWDVSALLRALLVHDGFYASAVAAPYDADAKKSVKWPVDFVVGTLNLLGMKGKGRELRILGGDFAALRESLNAMGQVLFDPPSVFGWDWETGWLSNAALLARYAFVRNLTAARSGGRLGFPFAKLVDPALTDADAIVAAAAAVLGIEDQLVAADRDAYAAYLTDGGLGATVDLGDPAVRDTKLRGLFALLLQSPAYQLH